MWEVPAFTGMPMSDITRILESVKLGDGQRSNELLSMVYDELHKLAESHMAREPRGHTLVPTALVNEAWLRLVADEDRTWHNRAYFFSSAATAMRRILVEHARRKSRLKHGGGQERVDIDVLDLAAAEPDETTLLVDDALEQLEKVNPEWARIAVMKYFGGMTNQEVAEALGISERSVDRRWLAVKAWLFNTISKQL